MRLPVPARTELTAPYWEALEAGTLVFQQCSDGHVWLPARTSCPRCLSDRVEWTPASGRARLVSWVVFRRSYSPAFADRVPYNVALVELVEGPRMISNLIVSADAHLVAGMPLLLQIEIEDGISLARFRPE